MSFGKPVFDNCSKCDCGEKRLIVNKTRYLCDEKNRVRLDENKKPKEKVTLSEIKKTLRTIKPINQLSKPKAKQNQEYKKVCQEIDEERGLKCESCGTTQYLSHSHLIPRSRRQDLITEPKNIKIQCTCRVDGSKGCHQRYEDSQIDDFIDKEEILSIVKGLDKQYYYLKFSK